MADFEAHKLDDIHIKQLNELYERSPQYLTQHPAFARALSNDSFHIGVFKKTELICAIPLMPHSSKLEKQWITPLFAPFSGPLVDEYFYQPGLATEKFWRDCFQAIVDLKIKWPSFSNMILPPGVIDGRQLIWNDWEAVPHYNYVSRWVEKDSWRDQWDGSARRQVKKAQEKEGLRDIVHVASKTEDLSKLWKINAPHQNLDPKLSTSIESLGYWLDQLDLGFVVNIEDDQGAVHASGLFGFDTHRVYYLAGASNPNFHGSGAPSFLHARAMQEIDRRELPKVYDWVGANTQNIVSFKQNFAPELEMLVRLQRRGKKSNLINMLRG